LWSLKKPRLVIIVHPEQKPSPMIMIGGGSGIGLN
jgi:sulfite reductase alpha subunit-like flavoprotein